MLLRAPIRLVRLWYEQIQQIVYSTLTKGALRVFTSAGNRIESFHTSSRSRSTVDRLDPDVPL